MHIKRRTFQADVNSTCKGPEAGVCLESEEWQGHEGGERKQVVRTLERQRGSQ